jgi:uncharacterized protein
MIRRDALAHVKYLLAHFDSVALLGPRQVGKTTLAREIVSEMGDGARYLDLENPIDRRQLDDPNAYFRAYADKLIVLDEVQRAPEIFSVLRGEIDERRRMAGKGGKFLILGSASMELLRQSSESLAGRIAFAELPPLQPSEYLTDRQTVDAQTERDATDTLWLKGGFPQSILRLDPDSSLIWRANFIRTYLERDVQQFGFQSDPAQLEQFWRMLANDQGDLFNAQRYAKSMGISGHTIAKYLDIFEKLLLVRRLRPWSVNMGKRLVKSPRPYIRDSGLLHALLSLKTIDDLRGHSVIGKSWEGFVIEALINAAGDFVRPYFYRTAAGAEADLILEFSATRRWAFEIKLSSAPTVERGFHTASDDVQAERRILVHRGEHAFPMRGGIEALPLLGAIAAVKEATAGI